LSRVEIRLFRRAGSHEGEAGQAARKIGESACHREIVCALGRQKGNYNPGEDLEINKAERGPYQEDSEEMQRSLEVYWLKNQALSHEE
jgi:hypothetical protein